MSILHYSNMNQGSSIYLLACGLHDQVISVTLRQRQEIFSTLKNPHRIRAQKVFRVISVCGHFPNDIMPDLYSGASGFKFLQD